MIESKKEWKVVDGYYPGFLNIVGASYKVSIVTSATELTIEDYVNRTNDAHLMAAAPDLLEALENLLKAFDGAFSGVYGRGPLYIAANSAIIKARGQQ